MRSFLMSALARMYASGDLESFKSAHPNCWVLWEPGTWTPPRKASASSTIVIPAAHADGGTPASLKIGAAPEALVLALMPRSKGANQVTLGRASDADIEINDATISNLHLVFMRDPQGNWTVRDAGSKNGSFVDDAPLTAGVPKALANGARIRAAQVALTFYTPDGMFSRLRTNNTPPPQPRTA